MCWTTSFLWYGNLYHGRRSARGEFPSVPGIGTGVGRRTHGTDGAQVAQLRIDHAVDLLGGVAPAGGRAALGHVVARPRPADHDRTRRVGDGPVRRDALALEVLDLELEDAPDVVDGERRRDLVGEV